ncbi:hypothetical protein HNQ64_001303 [Prosthecobacter dejongeii]|uniref:Uncharacterized protein n=1 Tax=Prosthecobacter dejongeii TaxID=48465 RepID=A0A7W7YJ30_9BACT|nr:hypothetical protein [Prosthecobacter dejongeii]
MGISGLDVPFHSFDIEGQPVKREFLTRLTFLAETEAFTLSFLFRPSRVRDGTTMHGVQLSMTFKGHLLAQAATWEFTLL